MLFDTDILIWYLRGKEKAARAIDRQKSRHISVVSYMELLQGARNRDETRAIKRCLADLAFQMLPLTENIGHRAAIYMEEYALRVDLCLADALIGATAVEHQQTLQTGNAKHFKIIAELEVKTFRS